MERLLTISSGEAEQPFQWSVGRYGSVFFTELKENKRIVGIRCPKCGKVYVPPRMVCGPCFVEMDEFVEVGPRGTIYCFTVLNFGFVDPDTGKQRPVPYGYGYIGLDGADTRFPHFLDETDPSRIRVGMRVEPVFEEERRGSLLDIRYFRIVEQGE